MDEQKRAMAAFFRELTKEQRQSLKEEARKKKLSTVSLLRQKGGEYDHLRAVLLSSGN